MYLPVEIDAPIQQGDIFTAIPSVRLSLRNIPHAAASSSDEIHVADWIDLAESAESTHFILDIKPAAAMVLTPDCDALRGEVITLAEIHPFGEVEGKARQTTSPKKLAKIITQHSRINVKWFYLPKAEQVPFTERMAVDFRAVLSVPREDLEEVRSLRCASLGPPAKEHLRERLADFFRRYPYDEWYPLDQEQFAAYKKDKGGDPDIVPFPWQDNSE